MQTNGHERLSGHICTILEHTLMVIGCMRGFVKN
jgi:hypothetical protein